MSAPATAAAPPLARFRMVDLTRQLPGPFCSMLLADLGMDVLAVNAPGDPMAMLGPDLGRNKRSLTLNLKAPEGRAIFQRLVADADVVLEGGRPGGAARLGIDYETLRRGNPRLVYCSISGYGQDGPYRDRVGHDVNYLGFAGVLDLTGAADGPPAIPGVQIADVGGGALMAAIGILAALFAREVTGAGQLVDVAMLDGAFAWQVVNLLQASRQGEALRRGATVLTGRHPCYALYETKDGRWLAVGALEPHFWRNLCARLGLPELYAAQFAEGGERDEAFRRLGARFRERTQADWARELADLEVCVSPVATLAEALEDPQLRYRQMVVPVAEGSERPRAALGHPIKLSATPATRHRPAPRLGQHTGEVLGALGYSGADLARLRERGVV